MSEHAFAGATNAEAAQAKLIARLACPLTRGDVDVFALETAGGAVRRGSIFSRETGQHVGRIDNFQLDFVRIGDGQSRDALRTQAQSGLIPSVTENVAEWTLVAHSSPQISYDVPPKKMDEDEMVAVEDAGATIRFEASGEIELVLYAHPWSGLIEIRYLVHEETIDLYAPHLTIPHPIRLDLGATQTEVEIKVTGRKNDFSFYWQCLFGGYRHKTGRMIPLRHHKQAKVRGASFTAAFYQLLAEVPPDGVLLDIGGGNRQIDDSRYINMDYAEFTEPDMIGDATQLPLRDGSVDAVYSTGVFEHLNDPQKAGAEVARVLKPGGKAIISWAFMQPIHSEGQHFYNATPWGVERAFAALKVKRFWYDNSFAVLVRWGALVSGLHGQVPAEEIEAVCQTLQRWDALVPPTHQSYMANSVWCELEKE